MRKIIGNHAFIVVVVNNQSQKCLISWHFVAIICHCYQHMIAMLGIKLSKFHATFQFKHLIFD